jgi:hypothetical protein
MEIVCGVEWISLFLAEPFDAPVLPTRPDPSLPRRARVCGVRVASIGSVPSVFPFQPLGATLPFFRVRHEDFDRPFCLGILSLCGAAGYPGIRRARSFDSRIFVKRMRAILTTAVTSKVPEPVAPGQSAPGGEV